MRIALIEFILKAVLSFLAGKEIKLGDIEIESGEVSEKTRQRALKCLVALGMIKQQGKTYVPSEKLMELLAKQIEDPLNFIGKLYQAFGQTLYRERFLQDIETFLKTLKELQEETLKVEKG